MEVVQYAQGRCGYGPRLPYLVLSPYAKENYVDHSLTDHSSSIRFIEDIEMMRPYDVLVHG